MFAIVEQLAPLIIFVVLLAIGFGFGRAKERRHLQSLEERESMARAFTVDSLKRPPEGVSVRESFLCSGSIVIGSDYFKSVGASLKSLVGGRLRTFETLLERARREATLRMMADAKERGADLVINTRFETSSIGRMTGNNGLAASEVVAYGTALKLDRA